MMKNRVANSYHLTWIRYLSFRNGTKNPGNIHRCRRKGRFQTTAQPAERNRATDRQSHGVRRCIVTIRPERRVSRKEFDATLIESSRSVVARTCKNTTPGQWTAFLPIFAVRPGMYHIGL